MQAKQNFTPNAQRGQQSPLTRLKRTIQAIRQDLKQNMTNPVVSHNGGQR